MYYRNRSVYSTGDFQVFGETDNGTGIRVISECLFIDELSHSRSAVVVIHVVLFVYGFQFGLEAPEYGVYKTFGIDFEPFSSCEGGKELWYSVWS